MRKGRGWNWWGWGVGARVAADHGLPLCLQLDREHKVAGLFPRPTFKDKSTYIESSTKVYDDVSVPHSGPRGGSPSTHTPLDQEMGSGWGSRASACRLMGPSILYGLCHTRQCSVPAPYTSCPSSEFPGPPGNSLGLACQPRCGWVRVGSRVPAPPCAPQMAFRYLSWILFPLLGCYAVYSLLYLEHKGWYSWVLSMLYGFLLTFGEQALPHAAPLPGADSAAHVPGSRAGPRRGPAGSGQPGPVLLMLMVPCGRDSSPDGDDPGWAGVAREEPWRGARSRLGVREGFQEAVHGTFQSLSLRTPSE